MWLTQSYLIGLYILGAFYIINADEYTHKYNDREKVIVWMNTVGSYQETYPYFSLPFCSGVRREEKSISQYHETLGEAVQGVHLVFSGYYIEFKNDVQPTVICMVPLSKQILKAFSYAVTNDYWYEMYIDGMSIRGKVGEKDEREDKYYIYTHKKFEISYNGQHIVDINLSNEKREELKPDSKISFTYEVNWKPSKVQLHICYDKNPEHQIHWFSILISFMMVIFLVGVVSMILMRSLRKDYARYSKDEEKDMERDLGDEYGWKQVHGDVFRCPSHVLLFSALIGNGYQLISVVFCVAIIGELYTERGSMLSNAIFVYAATSPINGYFGGSLYARLGGLMWIRQMLVSAFLVPASVFGFSFFIIAIGFYALREIPENYICLFVILPLTLVGTVLGRYLDGHQDFPCRVNAMPRPIPEKKWFMKPACIILLGGLLPFVSIFIELYFIFTSFWAYKIYYVYGFMLLVFTILTVVTVCVTILCTYFLLNAEDYRWHWTSFLSAASTSIYAYAYSFYYFFFNTKIYGLFETELYFCSMTLFSGALGIICGTVGYVGSSFFVRKIYSKEFKFKLEQTVPTQTTDIDIYASKN